MYSYVIWQHSNWHRSRRSVYLWGLFGAAVPSRLAPPRAREGERPISLPRSSLLRASQGLYKLYYTILYYTILYYTESPGRVSPIRAGLELGQGAAKRAKSSWYAQSPY